MNSFSRANKMCGVIKKDTFTREGNLFIHKIAIVIGRYR